MGTAMQQRGWWRGAGRGAAACLGLLALAGALAACDGSALGLGKTAPDEFVVVPNAPLTLPPDYSLRPPQPGAPRPNEAPLREQAETALLNDAGAAGDAAAAGATPGETALIAEAGASDVDPAIRQIVDREFSAYASESDSVVDDILFWRPDRPPGEVVDPVAEARRLRENAALGKPVTEGETPRIERRDRALLEGVF